MGIVTLFEMEMLRYSLLFAATKVINLHRLIRELLAASLFGLATEQCSIAMCG